MNVNFPDLPRGTHMPVKITTLGKRSYDNAIVERVDPRRRTYYWIGGEGFHPEDIPGSDCNAIMDGCIAMTALHCRAQDFPANEALRTWGLEQP